MIGPTRDAAISLLKRCGFRKKYRIQIYGFAGYNNEKDFQNAYQQATSGASSRKA